MTVPKSSVVIATGSVSRAGAAANVWTAPAGRRRS
jgi:hypothetical protein